MAANGCVELCVLGLCLCFEGAVLGSSLSGLGWCNLCLGKKPAA